MNRTVGPGLRVVTPQKAGNKKPEYSFNQQVRDQLKGFEAWLKEPGNGESTIRQKSNYAGYFLQWLEAERLQPEDARYNDLLDFVDYCKSEGNSKKHINSKLRSIRSFYQYLKTQNPTIINPATNLHLKGTHKKAISGVIDFKELETLYHCFAPKAGQVPPNDNRGKRNKVILGLLVYQGVTTEELHRLEPGHLKLKEGKIQIPGNRRRNSRTLELKPFQILELHEYVNKVRPKIIQEITQPKPARKPDRINKSKLENQLFISINGSENIKNSLLHLFRDVRKITPGISSAGQIRQSTITYWLKTMNLRQVQYMSGHKYVSSTERYQAGNLENLQIRLEKCHPLSCGQPIKKPAV
jgi:integrase/recombinase XerD